MEGCFPVVNVKMSQNKKINRAPQVINPNTLWLCMHHSGSRLGLFTYWVNNDIWTLYILSLLFRSLHMRLVAIDKLAALSPVKLYNCIKISEVYTHTHTSTFIHSINSIIYTQEEGSSLPLLFSQIGQIQWLIGSWNFMFNFS